MGLYVALSVFDTLKFILSNGNIDNNQNKLTHSGEQELLKLVQNYNDGSVLNLAVAFAASYNIYLSFIAFHENRFQIVNEYSFPDRTKQRLQSFIVLNGNFTVCGPLSSVALDGRRQAIYPFGDIRAKWQVDKYIEELNRIGKFYFNLKLINYIEFSTDTRSFPKTDETHQKDMQMDHPSSLPTESNTGK